MKKTFLWAVGLCLLTSCHQQTAVEQKADEFCEQIVESFKNGNTEAAEKAVQDMNEYTRTLSKDDARLFMNQYETHSNEIMEAATKNIQGALEKASAAMNSDGAAVIEAQPNEE